MIRDLLKEASMDLAKAGLKSARLDVEVLCAYVLGISRDELYMDLERRMKDEEIRLFWDLIKRRKRNEPLAYITGVKEFMSMEFEVNPHVLIPRPETELLVEKVIKTLEKKDKKERKEVIEIGTGCGNIAITLARYLNCVVYATDISPQALQVASRNAARLGVKEKVYFLCGELFSPLKRIEVDAVVSNPPYIPSSQWRRLPQDVKDFEPRIALDGGVGGFRVHKKIIKEASSYLKKEGFLALEMGIDQAGKIIEILKQHSWSSISIVKDHQGIDRVVIASKSHLD